MPFGLADLCINTICVIWPGRSLYHLFTTLVQFGLANLRIIYLLPWCHLAWKIFVSFIYYLGAIWPGKSSYHLFTILVPFGLEDLCIIYLLSVPFGLADLCIIYLLSVPFGLEDLCIIYLLPSAI